MFLTSQFFFNWLHSFKETHEILLILKGCCQLSHKGTFFGLFAQIPYLK